ncbi:MAG: hypothetical protein OXI01_22695 [Albidovulum sp.]|nr:hypothetical protein [Albidovulum sp.]
MSENANERERPRPVGNIVLKVENYDTSVTRLRCYRGIIEGTAAGGAMDGRKIAIALRKTPSNQMVSQIADFIDPSAMAHSPPGSYLAFSNASIEKGAYTATWVNKLADPDSDMRLGLPIRISPSIDKRGRIRRFRSNGATVYEALVMHSTDTEITRAFGQLKDAVCGALEYKSGCVLAVSTESPGGGRDRRTGTVWRGWRNGAPETLEVALERIFSEKRRASVERVFELGGIVDVVPLERLPVAPKSAESADRGKRSAIALESFKTGGVGRRFDRIASRAEGDLAKFLVAQFLAEADAPAKAAYMDGGWRTVSDRAIRSFCARRGLKLPKTSEFGFAVSTASVLSRANTRESAAEGGFLAKVRALSAAVPYDAVPTYSDPNALQRYYGGFEQALEQLERTMKESEHRAESKERPETGFPSVESASEPVGCESTSADAREENAEGGSSERKILDSFGNLEI